VKLLEDNLQQYAFVAYGQLENGDFDAMEAKVLLLPQSIAMSSKEVDSVERFVERGGTVVADCRTALMDEHCKSWTRVSWMPFLGYGGPEWALRRVLQG